MAIVYCYGDNKLADAHAKETAEILSASYPNHSWWVECKGGVIVIKHFGISGTIGMLRKLSQLVGDSTARKREIVRAAGELLERAGLPRRDYRGEAVTKFEADARILKHFRRLPPPGIIH